MSDCCCSNPKEESVKDSGKLGRQQQVERDVAREREQTGQSLRVSAAHRDRQRQEEAREQTAFIQRIQREKQDLVLQYSKETLRQRQAAQALQAKEELFKKALEQDAVKNSKAVKRLIEDVDSLKQIGELESIRPIQLSVTFTSITEYFGVPERRHSRINQSSDVVVQKLMEVYSFFTRGKIFERGLLIGVECYLRFLQEVIRVGYSQSLGDLQLKEARAFMRDNAKLLYQRLEDLLAIAKDKFTKDRSRILEEMTVDNSHDQMKLRSKVEELQKRIQQLLDENSQQRAANQLLSSTIAGLKEQLNRRELQAMEQMSSALGELQRTVVGREEVEGHFQHLQRLLNGATMVYSSEQMAEVVKQKDNAIEKLQAQLARMQKEKSLFSDETEPERKQLALELQGKQMEILELTRSLEDKDSMIRLMEEAEKERSVRYKALNEKMLEKQREIVSLRSMVEDLQEEIRRGDSEQRQPPIPSNAQQQATREKTQQIAAFTSQLQVVRLREHSNSQKITALQQTNAALSYELQTIKAKNQSIQQKIEKYASQNTQLGAKLENESRKFEQQLSEQQFKRSDAQMRANSAQGQLLQVRDQISKIKRQKKDLENQLASQRFEAERARSETDIFKMENERVKAELQGIRGELLCWKGECEQLKKELIEMRLKIQKMQAEKDETAKAITTLREISMQGERTRMRTASFVEHRTLFIGDVLQRRKGEKKYLMDAIEALMMREIQKTKLLYEYRRDQKINFHNFIDGHSNIVIVIETEKALLACYYSGVVREDAPMTEESLLLSLDSRKTYFLNTPLHNPNKDPKDTRLIRGMVYDKYFLIFGNAQVRIRTGEAGLFSNFGITSSYFDARKQKVGALLHQGNNNEVLMCNYEIHEVFFSEEFTLESTH